MKSRRLTQCGIQIWPERRSEPGETFLPFYDQDVSPPASRVNVGQRRTIVARPKWDER